MSFEPVLESSLLTDLEDMGITGYTVGDCLRSCPCSTWA